MVVAGTGLLSQFWKGTSMFAGRVLGKQVVWSNGSGLSVAVDDGRGDLLRYFGKGDIVAGLGDNLTPRITGAGIRYFLVNLEVFSREIVSGNADGWLLVALTRLAKNVIGIIQSHELSKGGLCSCGDVL